MKRRVLMTTTVAALAACAYFALAGGATLASPSARSSANLPTITLAMDGHSITVGGSLQSGAVDIHSTNTAKHETEPSIVRLNPGVTADQAFAYLTSKAGSDPNNASKVGAIVFDQEAPKGTSDAQTTLAPGNYLFADTHGDHPKQYPHTAVTISQSSAPASLPTPRATEKAIEFSFRGPKTLDNGELVRFENGGYLVHMIVGLRVKNMADARRLKPLLRAANEKKANKLIKGFVSFQDPVSPGAVVQEVVKAKPGIYFLACFMDTQDHREHIQLGMYRVIRIRK